MTSVFVGNLAFSTSEQAIKDFFAPVAAAESVVLVKRGTRPLGFGFVEFATAADAEKAVAEKNATTLDEREIVCEVARERPEGEPKPRKKKGKKPKAEGAEGAEGEDADGEAKPKTKKRKPRRRKAPEPQPRVDAATGLFVANLPFSVNDEQ